MRFDITGLPGKLYLPSRSRLDTIVGNMSIFAIIPSLLVLELINKPGSTPFPHKITGTIRL